jgi:hypothetical protein
MGTDFHSKKPKQKNRIYVNAHKIINVSEKPKKLDLNIPFVVVCQVHNNKDDIVSAHDFTIEVCIDITKIDINKNNSDSINSFFVDMEPEDMIYSNLSSVLKKSTYLNDWEISQVINNATVKMRDSNKVTYNIQIDEYYIRDNETTEIYRAIIINSLLPDKKKTLNDIGDSSLNKSKRKSVITDMISNNEIETIPGWNFKLSDSMREKYN